MKNRVVTVGNPIKAYERRFTFGGKFEFEKKKHVFSLHNTLLRNA